MDFIGDAGAAVQHAADQLKQVNQLAGQAQGMVQAANNGDLMITPQAAQIKIDCYRKCLDTLHGLNKHVATVSQVPKLGGSPVALAVAQHTASMGSHPTDGLGAAVQNAIHMFEQMIQAVQKAMQNYQEHEQNVAASMKQQHHGLS